MVKETVECLKSLSARRHGSIRRLSGRCRSSSTCARIRASNWGLPRSRRFYFISGGNGPTNYGNRRPRDGRRSDRRFFYTSGAKRQTRRTAGKNRARENGCGSPNDIKKVCEINISVSSDYEKARNFPKRYIAHMLVVLEAMGFSNEEFQALGVERETVIQIKQAFETGGTIEQVSALISDEMVDVGFIAGTPRDCVTAARGNVRSRARIRFRSNLLG